MFLGTLKKKISVKGYLNKNLFEPLSLKERHDSLVKEMLRREFKHKSPLEFTEEVFNYLEGDKFIKINKETAKQELLRRCPKCGELNHKI